jgi:hypothetical protein
MVAATMALLNTIHCQNSAECGPPHDGRREAVTTCDTPLERRGERALLAWSRASGGWWQVSFYSITSHYPPPA